MSKVITRTIERGVRASSKSKSIDSDLNLTPVQLVKQQLTSFAQHADDEKKVLGTLNDRMGIYVDRVKALEAENFKLLKEIQDSQGRWGEGTRLIKQQYQKDLYDLRSRLDDTANLRAIADVKVKRADYEAKDLEGRLKDLQNVRDGDKYKIGNLENELDQTKSNIGSLNKALSDGKQDVDKYRGQRDELLGRLGEVLDRLDDELLRRVTTEFTNQTLREHIEFIKQVHEKEVSEMESLKNALPFNDQMQFYKDELKRVIGNIRNDYDQLSREQARELEEWMKARNEELLAQASARDPAHDLEMGLHSDNIENLRGALLGGNNELDDIKRQQELLLKRLQEVEDRYEAEKQRIGLTLENQSVDIDKLKEAIAALLNDYNHLNTNKANLEYEIQVYKRLLDSQLHRLGAAPTEVRDTNTATTSSGAFGGKVQNRREKKGSVGIADSAPDGKFISIENSGGTNNVIADLSGWKLRRKVDNGSDISYTIPTGTLLVPGAVIRIWSSSNGRSRTGNDLVNADLDNWGIGIQSVTHLLNPDGDEKSTFNQQITFGNY